MKTLHDAWQWYLDAAKVFRLFGRLGEKHWPIFDWDNPEFSLSRDRDFRLLEAVDLTRPAENALAALDDLAVLVIFSVFEGIVRETILDEIGPELLELRHRSLANAAAELTEKVRNGSFFRVLEPYGEPDPGLTEEVNQVRRYRNWVAHGKRSAAPDAVTPTMAYGRLRRFLERFAAVPVRSEDSWLASFRETHE